MHIKRFEGSTLEAALDRVRSELGPDALILSTRTIRKGRSALGLWARESVEVQAGLERHSQRSAQATRSDPHVDSIPKDSRAVGAEAELETLLMGLRRELATLRSREDFEEELRGELRDLRRAIDIAFRDAGGDRTEESVAKLMAGGLDWSHAASIAGQWRARVADGEPVELETVLRERVEAALTPPRAEERPGIRMLVGAPGVGKTTTLAKLAARNEEGERDVALVSMDPYRIGAQDQLRRYAELLDSPFCEVSRAGELREVASRHRGHSLLIDTAGRGKRFEDRLESLEGLRQGLTKSAVGRPVSIELVIDATARPEVQQAQLERFAPLGPDRVILSKTDECDSMSAALNLLLRRDCPPLCWLADGQRVPEDLRIAEAEMFLSGGAGRAA